MNKCKFREKCVEKYDASAEGASRKFFDMPIVHRNLLWNINFLKFPWLFLNFPDFKQISKIESICFKMIAYNIIHDFLTVFITFEDLDIQR